MRKLLAFLLLVTPLHAEQVTPAPGGGVSIGDSVSGSTGPCIMQLDSGELIECDSSLTADSYTGGTFVGASYSATGGTDCNAVGFRGDDADSGLATSNAGYALCVNGSTAFYGDAASVLVLSPPSVVIETGTLDVTGYSSAAFNKIVPQADPPGTPTAGFVYVDSSPNPDELCFYDGAAWQGISSGTDANCQ